MKDTWDKTENVKVGIREPEFDYLKPDVFIFYDSEENYGNYTMMDVAKYVFPEKTMLKEDSFETVINAGNTKVKITVRELKDDLLHVNFVDLDKNKEDIQIIHIDQAYTKDGAVNAFLTIISQLLKRLLIY